jgi:hypothetical protein
MSASTDTVADLRDAFLAGEIDREEFLDRVGRVAPEEDRDGLWATWAAQGLFDEPIEQEGWTSFAGNRVREVFPDGER